MARHTTGLYFRASLYSYCKQKAEVVRAIIYDGATLLMAGGSLKSDYLIIHDGATLLSICAKRLR